MTSNPAANAPTVLNVAVIGLGHLHPRSYMPLFEAEGRTRVTSVVEADDSRREVFCADFDVNGYPSVDDLLKAEKLDIAAIFLPHADCPEAAEACAAAGLHLMVEKPMAASAQGALRICKAAESAGVKLTTGYCWRMHPVAGQFKQLIDAGTVGRIVGAEGRCAAGRLHRYIEGGSPWMLQKARSGGGPMYNLGVHWIDLFRWMLGQEVVEVSGRNVKVNTEYDIEDNSFAHLRFDGGAIASLDISYTVPDSFPYGRDLYLAVRGTSGAVWWAPAYEGQQDVLYVCSDSAGFGGSPRRSIAFEMESVPGYSGPMGHAYLKDFVDAIVQDRQPVITGEDGLKALQVVEAVYASARQKCWVDVNR